MNEPDLEWDPPSSLAVAPKYKLWLGEELPRTDRVTEQSRHHLRRISQTPLLEGLCKQFCDETGLSLSGDGPMVTDRPSGIKRVGITVQWLVPSLGTRFAFGLETTLVHRVIDRVTGFERSEAQHHLPTTPVEWGFWTVLAARLTDSINSSNLIPRVLLDRVGADTFDFSGLGGCHTFSWELFHQEQPVGMVRAWLPDTVLNTVHWQELGSKTEWPESLNNALSDVCSRGRVQAGFIDLPEGLSKLRPRLVLPWPDSPLSGVLPTIDGPVICRLGEGPHRWTFAARLLTDSKCSQIEILNKPRPTPSPSKKGSLMSADANPADSTDLPVTLTIELGRLSLSLSRLADLKPGDVLNLSRNSREPVELTSGDRLVARGELVQMDEELGVRILQVLI